MRIMDFIAWAIILIAVIFFYKSCIKPHRQVPFITDNYRQQLLEEERNEATRRGGGSWRRHN